MKRLPALARTLATGLLLATALLFAGCPAPREVDRLAFVTVAAFDRTPAGEVRWTVEIPRPSAMATAAAGAGGDGGRGPAGGRPVVIHEGTGPSLSEAERQLAQRVTRELFWAHANYLLVGEAAARAGLAPLFEFATRRFQVRRTALLFVTPDDAGSALRRLKPALDRTVGSALRSTVRAARPRAFKEVDVNTAVRRLAAPGIDPYLPVVAPSGDASGETVPVLAGTALFKADRLVAFLAGRPEQGLYWMRGEIRSLLLTVPCPGPASFPGTAAIRVRSSSASVRVRALPEGLRAAVRISAEGEVEEWGCRTPTSSATLRAVERRAAGRVRADAEAALAVMRAAGVDPVGFGAALHRSDPERWATLEARW